MASVAAVSEAGLRNFFVHAVRAAARNQQVRAQHCTVEYIGDLLTRFARSDALFGTTRYGYGLAPLADMYADALEEPSAKARAEAFRRMGDVALFIAGVFSGSLQRSLVDVDYYIAMGGGAYGAVSRTTQSSSAPPAGDESVFDELSRKFGEFVDVLDEVGEHSAGRRETDVVRNYEVWLSTGSVRAAKKLRRQGVIPVRSHGRH